MGALAAGEHPHGGGPARQLVTSPALAQQPGEFGDVRFFHPAASVSAATIGASVISAAFAHLAMVTDRDLPRLPGDSGDRVLLPLAQVPADGVDQLMAGPETSSPAGNPRCASSPAASGPTPAPS